MNTNIRSFISFKSEPFAFVDSKEKAISQLILVGVLGKHEHIETCVCSGQKVRIRAHPLNLKRYLPQPADGRLSRACGEEQKALLLVQLQ